MFPRHFIFVFVFVLTKGHPCTGGLVVDPEGDPGEHDNQDWRQVRLEHKVANVSL